MEVNIRIAGAAGQGLQTNADVLGKAILRSNLHAYLYTDAESRIRGGLNFSHLRVADRLCQGVVDEVQLLVALSSEAVEAFAPKLKEDGLLICAGACTHPRSAQVSLDQVARQIGSPKVSGLVGISLVCALLDLDRGIVGQVVAERFGHDPKAAASSQQAIDAGFELSIQLAQGTRFHLPPASDSVARLWIAGHEAISLGAVAGGVSFVAGYPMSPATSILTDLAAWQGRKNLLVEQAEDEIAAINLVAGASYAGARAMTVTSGGGFDLMTEGVSLLGMIEVPAVIVLGQRPGPSTGLPTRTAQGDLHLVLHGGHGTFPRVVLAPRDVRDGFEITARAFDIAERYQVPVFILTDQLLQDSQAVVNPFDFSALPTNRHLLDASKMEQLASYQRYAQTESGVSPRAAPGTSSHVVVVDSDEHDEDGHMIESAEMAGRMAQKRLRKAKTLQQADLLGGPVVQGTLQGKPLLVSWGSTYHTLAEASMRLAAEGLEAAHLHLRQLWPLPQEQLRKLFALAASITVVENNVGGELADLLRQVTLLEPKHVITRLDGRPMNVDELASQIKDEVRS